MVEVDVHVDRMVLPEHPSELRRDALRQRKRNASAYADYLDVFYLPEPLENGLESIVVEQERISAGYEHVAYRGMLRYVAEARFEVGGIDSLPAAELTLAGAEAAIGGAFGRDEEEAAVGILVDDVGDWRKVFLAERIGKKVLTRGEFRWVGKELLPYRLAAGLDELEDVRRKAHGEGPCDFVSAAGSSRRLPQYLFPAFHNCRFPAPEKIPIERWVLYHFIALAALAGTAMPHCQLPSADYRLHCLRPRRIPPSPCGGCPSSP